MVDYLIIFICILSIFQTTAERRFPAMVFAMMCGFHSIAFSTLEGFWYCFTAGTCDLIIIGVICCCAIVTRLSDRLIMLSVISIFLNVYGWLLYEFYLPVYIYNTSMTALYFIAILFLLRKDCANDESTTYKRYRCFQLFADKCGSVLVALREAKRA